MQTIVITGANRGIGLELVKIYLQAGERVLATCRNPHNAPELQALAAHQPQLQVYTLEVRESQSIADFAAMLAGQTVDVLINNAGVNPPEPKNLAEITPELLRDTFEINSFAPFLLSIALLPNLRQSKNARIVTISSQMGAFGRNRRGAHAYRSSKAAVNKLMQSLALDLQGQNIIVIPLHPGWVRTDMGGENADISTTESASGIFELVARLTMAESGRFWTWDGHEHVW